MKIVQELQSLQIERLNFTIACYNEDVQPFKDEAQTAVLKDPVRTAL
jgi:hypothetical protein